jgi:hypothetical protein
MAGKTVTLTQVRRFLIGKLRRKGEKGATPGELGVALARWLKKKDVDISDGIETVSEAIIWDPIFRKRTQFDGERTRLVETQPSRRRRPARPSAEMPR